jgi:hypothetical protein
MAVPSKYTPEQWTQSRALYESSKLSVRKIAEQCSMDPQAIESKLRREAWKRPHVSTEAALAKKARAKLEIKLENKLQMKADQLANRATEFKNRAISQSFEALDVLEDLTQRLKTEPINTESLSDCIQKLGSTLKTITDCGFKQFGLDQERTTVKVGLFLPVTILNAEQPEATYPATIDVETVSPTTNNTTDTDAHVD